MLKIKVTKCTVLITSLIMFSMIGGWFLRQFAFYYWLVLFTISAIATLLLSHDDEY